MTRVTAVHGTWGWIGLRTKGQWWQPGSWWWRKMAHYACEPVCPEMFAWSGDVNGMPWLRGRRYTDWEIGALGFAGYLRPPIAGPDRDRYVPIPQRRVFAHSFGGNIPLIACAVLDLKIDRLITLGTPVRKDMEEYARKALPNIVNGWVHIHAKGGFWADKMQAFGGFFDNRIGLQRDFKVDGMWNYAVPDIDHSKALHDGGDEPFGRALVQTGVLDWFTEAA